MLAYALLWSGDPLAAQQAAETSLSQGMSFPWLEDSLMAALLAQGKPDDPRVRGAAGQQS